jgi:hypothetical protein
MRLDQATGLAIRVIECILASPSATSLRRVAAFSLNPQHSVGQVSLLRAHIGG